MCLVVSLRVTACHCCRASHRVCQASICGAAEGKNGPWHYHTGHLHKTGRKLCKTLCVCAQDNEMRKALQEIRTEWVAGVANDTWRSAFADDNMRDYMYDSSGDDSGGSDGGAASDDNLESAASIGVEGADGELGELVEPPAVQQQRQEKKPRKVVRPSSRSSSQSAKSAQCGRSNRARRTSGKARRSPQLRGRQQQQAETER